MASLLNRDTLASPERIRARAAEVAVVNAINSEVARAEGAESLLTTAIDTALIQAQAFAAPAVSPLTWGDVIDMATWVEVNNDNATWAVAVNHTWGELVAVKTWQYVINSGKTWSNAINYTWETL